MWLSIVLYMVLIYLLSVQPDLDPGQPDYPIDKIGHAGAYGLLTLMIIQASVVSWGKNAVLSISVVAIIISIAFGTFNEWLQSSIPSRHAEFADTVCDALGAIAAAIAYHIYMKRKRHHGHPK